MTLRTKLLLATAAAALTVLGISEWLGYRHTLSFIQRHEELMVSQSDHTALIARLRSDTEQLRRHLFWLHAAHAALVVAALGAALTVLWYRLVINPLKTLLAHMRHIERGGGWAGLQVMRRDEIGELFAGFNRLSERLAFSMFQCGVSAKLSGMALMGHRILRDAVVTRDQVLAVALMLESGQLSSLAAGRDAGANLRAAAESLDRMRARFDAEFDNELRRYQRVGAGAKNSRATGPLPEMTRREGASIG